MNQTNTVMLAILVALAATTGLVSALSSVATSAHARVNQGACPASQGGTCLNGGSGQQGGGSGGHVVLAGDHSVHTGGEGHVGGAHHTDSISGGPTCVGSAC